MKKNLDTLLAWALFLMGVAFFPAAYLHRFPQFIGLWTSASATAVISVALMNAVRARRRNDRFLRWSTVLATLITTALCLRLLYDFPGNVLHQPVSLTVAVLVLIELLFAVAG
jgi:hypothetical protein